MFQTKGDVTNHVTSVHKFGCDVCKQSFTYIASLARHIKELHEESKHEDDLQCVTCHKSFPSRLQLQRHSRTAHKDKKVKSQVPTLWRLFQKARPFQKKKNIFCASEVL